LARETVALEELAAPGPLLAETMRALPFPAYIITATWDIIDCNPPFRIVWHVGENELPFNAIDRLFIAPAARKLHGRNFATNVAPVVAMLHSGIGRRPNLKGLRDLRDRLLADDEIRKIWNDFEIRSPFLPTKAEIQSSIGTFRYEALNLPVPGSLHALVVQVPDGASPERLARASFDKEREEVLPGRQSSA
jgi:MmyB-like transcription regulator ligand binding domain